MRKVFPPVSFSKCTISFFRIASLTNRSYFRISSSGMQDRTSAPVISSRRRCRYSAKAGFARRIVPCSEKRATGLDMALTKIRICCSRIRRSFRDVMIVFSSSASSSLPERTGAGTSPGLSESERTWSVSMPMRRRTVRSMTMTTMIPVMMAQSARRNR